MLAEQVGMRLSVGVQIEPLVQVAQTVPCTVVLELVEDLPQLLFAIFVS